MSDTDRSVSVPAWKFWWPLSIWHALLVFFITSVVAHLIWVGVCFAVGWKFSAAFGGGAGGAAGAVIVINWANRRRQDLAKNGHD